MKEFTVRQARERAKLTQDELATASGLDQTTISDFETGRNTNPRLKTIRALAKALRIRPVQLRFSAPEPDAIGTRHDDRVVHASNKAGHSESAR
jgi:transcriptional regulator with XRE-family HTH domain